jgi:histidinol-phosphatase
MNPAWRTRYEVAQEIAQQAAQVALRYFEQHLQVEWKADQSPVTAADREAEALLRQGLLGRFPQDGFLGEESGAVPGDSGFRWIVDPIDGTRSFVRGIPLWATLVGLEYRGEQLLGVAAAPALGHTWHALRGHGAYRDQQKIRVSEVADLAAAHLFYSSVSWFVRAGRQDTFLQLAARTQRQRGYGDFYGFVLVAQGSGDIMLEHGCHPWDLSAVTALVEEAGGRVTDWQGQQDIFHPDVVATNGRLHAAVLALLAQGATS